MENIDQDTTQQEEEEEEEEDETKGELKAEDLDSEDDFDEVDTNNKELQRTQDSQFVYLFIFLLLNFTISII